jgi:hypothetical protein
LLHGKPSCRRAESVHRFSPAPLRGKPLPERPSKKAFDTSKLAGIFEKTFTGEVEHRHSAKSQSTMFEPTFYIHGT